MFEVGNMYQMNNGGAVLIVARTDDRITGADGLWRNRLTGRVSGISDTHHPLDLVHETTAQQRYEWLMDQPIRRFNVFGMRLMIDLHGYLDMRQLPPGLADTLDRLYEGMQP